MLEIQKNYFKFNFKKASDLGKLYLLPEIQENLSNLPGRSVISNWEIPTEKVLGFVDHQLQTLMKQGNLYIKDTGDFLEKLTAIGKIAILVTVDVVGLYCSFLYYEGLKGLGKQYYKLIVKTVPTEDN